MNLLNPIQSLFFPVFCALCASPVDFDRDGAVCSSCWAQTKIFQGSETICFKCGRFHSEKKPAFRTYCRECDDDYYDTARAVGPYTTALSQTILKLKTLPFLAKRPSQLIFDAYVLGPFCNIDVIIPVPLSKKRRFERGFNQAELIADRLSKYAGLRVDKKSLVREKHIEASRASLDRKGRAMTVANAFAVKRPKLIEGKNILLIDDVFTSGATVSMSAKALKKKGAARVDVLTLARASKLN